MSSDLVLSDITEFINNSKNQNTVKKTNYNVKVLHTFFADPGETKNPEDIPFQELDILLNQFFMCAKSATIGN